MSDTDPIFRANERVKVPVLTDYSHLATTKLYIFYIHMVSVKLTLIIIMQNLNKEIIYIEASLAIHIFCN